MPFKTACEWVSSVLHDHPAACHLTSDSEREILSGAATRWTWRAQCGGKSARHKEAAVRFRYEMLRATNIAEAESRMMAASGRREGKWGGGGGGGYCLMNAGFRFHKMKRVVEMNGGDGYATT